MSEATAVFTKAGAGLFVTQFDLKTGKAGEESLLRTAYPEGPKPEYVGNSLLFNGRDYFDPVRKAVVWHYAAPGGTIAAQRPDNQLWYGIGTLGSQNGSTLLATTLPSPAVMSTVAAVADGPGSIIKPGVKVSLSLEFAGSHAEETKNKTSEAITRLWGTRGIEVVSKAPTMIVIKASEHDTGKKMEFTSAFRPQFAKGGVKTVDSARLMEVSIETSIVVDGKPVWSSPVVKHNNRPFGIFTVPKEEPSLETFLLRRMWDGVTPVATNSLPEYLTKTPQGVKSLPGYSILNASGVVDQK
jgi:hypothetical protein